MSPKRRQFDEEFERSESGLDLPRYGLRGPDRRKPMQRKWMPGYPCCCGGYDPCTHCASPKPTELLATMTGWSDCRASLNDSFVLTSGVSCWWEYQLGNICETGNYKIVARLSTVVTGYYHFLGFIQNAPSAPFVVWQAAEIEVPYACDSLDDYNVPLDSYSGAETPTFSLTAL